MNIADWLKEFQLEKGQIRHAATQPMRARMTHNSLWYELTTKTYLGWGDLCASDLLNIEVAIPANYVFVALPESAYYKVGSPEALVPRLTDLNWLRSVVKVVVKRSGIQIPVSNEAWDGKDAEFVSAKYILSSKLNLQVDEAPGQIGKVSNAVRCANKILDSELGTKVDEYGEKYVPILTF